MSLRISLFADPTKAEDERVIATLQYGANKVRLLKADWFEVTDVREVPPRIAYTAEDSPLWVLEVEM